MIYLIVPFVLLITGCHVHNYIHRPKKKKSVNPLLVRVPGVDGKPDIWLNPELAMLAIERNKKRGYLPKSVKGK